VIRIEIRGFRPFWLMTNLLDPAIPAREIALHYHRRWDLEIAYDEIKTHQCATLRGQAPTTFRSKVTGLLLQGEENARASAMVFGTFDPGAAGFTIFAGGLSGEIERLRNPAFDKTQPESEVNPRSFLLRRTLAITYNLVRTLMSQAATAAGQDPTTLSFLESLQHILDAAPMLTADVPVHREQKRLYLLTLIADCLIDRPRRPRVNPRVVKVKMSKFARKQATHQSEVRDLAKELQIVDVESVEATI
jgi:hypothetical protein